MSSSRRGDVWKTTSTDIVIDREPCEPCSRKLSYNVHDAEFVTLNGLIRHLLLQRDLILTHVISGMQLDEWRAVYTTL